MKLVDFLFTGVAVVPIVFASAGRPDIGMMFFCPLLIGACLIAAAKGDMPTAGRGSGERKTDRK